MSSKYTIKVGVPGEWITLSPPLQHTVYSGAIISNIFEPLVERGPNYSYLPKAAKAWKINEAFTEVELTIDDNKFFSNGKKLTAHIVKTAWEHSLLLAARSANHAPLDILYLIEGIEDAEKTGKISGVQATSDTRLSIKLKKPFRMFIQLLTSEYVAPYIIENDSYLGTGHYRVKINNPDLILLEKNPYNAEVKNEDLNDIEIRHFEPTVTAEKLRNDEIDLVILGHRIDFPECLDTNNSTYECIIGQEVAHSSLVLNGLQGKVFSDPDIRRLFQVKALESIPHLTNMTTKFKKPFFNLDAQSFLPLQAGRLERHELEQILNKTYSPDKWSKLMQSEIKVMVSEPAPWLNELFEKLNLKATVIKTDFATRINDYYKLHTADIYLNSHSVIGGDPDGIYHVLGEKGAIGSPVSSRVSIEALLESGRSISDYSSIDPHYKKVSFEIFKEVPWVHIGYSTDTTILNKKRIQFVGDFSARHEFRFKQIRVF